MKKLNFCLFPQRSGKQRKCHSADFWKCHCSLYNPLPLSITHLAPCILAAESQRQKKWQLYPVISRLQVLTMLMKGLFSFDPKNEKGRGKHNYSKLLIRDAIPEEYHPVSSLVLFNHYVILKYSMPSTDSTSICLTALYMLSTHNDQSGYNSEVS